MAEINYSVAAMKNPMKQSEPPKYYAKMQANGVVDMDDLAEEILMCIRDEVIKPSI